MKDEFYTCQLRDLLVSDAVRPGDFTLKSGRRSRHYVDCDRVTMTSEGGRLVAACLWSLIGRVVHPPDEGSRRFDAVGGPLFGAAPIAMALVAHAGAMGVPMRSFAVDKRAERVVGPPLGPGRRVVVVEDVTTTGKTLADACDVVAGLGCRVVLAVSLVSRMGGQGGVPGWSLSTLHNRYYFASLFHARELGIDDGD